MKKLNKAGRLCLRRQKAILKAKIRKEGAFVVLGSWRIIDQWDEEGNVWPKLVVDTRKVGDSARYVLSVPYVDSHGRIARF